jgi:hypothetical protein
VVCAKVKHVIKQSIKYSLKIIGASHNK